MYGTTTSIPFGSPPPPTSYPTGPWGTPTPVNLDRPPVYSSSQHTTHTHTHRRRRRPKNSEPSRNRFTSLFGCCADTESPGRKKAQKVQMRERTGMAVEIDSDDENDWDRGAAAKKVWGDRAGPMRERPVDDLIITFNDLFPCLAPIFEACGCGKRRPRRMLQSRAVKTPGPKIETVCLDCGNVLDAKHLPHTVGVDMFDRCTPEHHQAQAQLQGFGTVTGLDGLKQSAGTYKGYPEWSVQPNDDFYAYRAAGYQGAIPLPKFDAAPARTFQNRPTEVGRYEDEGPVELPTFPFEEPTTAPRTAL